MQFHQSTNFINSANGNVDQLQSQHIKRMRTGSISGRLRTASDLEDSGIIDKYQKGIIKDLIISGDIALQQSLDKCEKGDTSSLTDLIKRGCLARKQSIDLLDGLDFEFLNGIKTEDDDLGYVFDDDLMFDFVNDQFMSGAANGVTVTGTCGPDATLRSVGSIDMHDEKQQRSYNARTSSMDSNFSGSFRMFDNMPMFRGHSFGDEANLLMSGADIDNLYYEDERYEEGGPGAENGNLYSIGHHHSAFTEDIDQQAPTTTKRQSKKHSDNTGGSSTHQSENIDMSAYESHAVALRNNTRDSESNMKPGLKGRHNRGVPKNSSGMDHLQDATFNNSQYRQYSDHSSFASGSQKQSALKNTDATFGGVSLTGRKSKGIPTFNQFSSAAHGVTNFGAAAAAGFNDDDKNSRVSVAGSGGGMLYKLSNNLGGPNGGVGFIGAYSPEQRRLRIEKFFEKRNRRVWTKKVKYDVRKNFADSRLRIKGRFVKKEDEDIMRELLDI